MPGERDPAGTKGQRYYDSLFDPDGWTSNEGNTYRYKLFTEPYESKDKDGKKKSGPEKCCCIGTTRKPTWQSASGKKNWKRRREHGEACRIGFSDEVRRGLPVAEVCRVPNG